MLAKIKWFQVAIIAAVLTVIAVAGIYFGLIDPVNKRLVEAKSNYDTQVQARDTAKAALPVAVKDTAKAKVEVAVAERDWARYDRALMPNIDLSNRFTATQQLWNEQLKVLGPKVLKFLYDDRTVRVLDEKIAIDRPLGDPNAVVKKVFEYPLGNITVSGTFEQVLRHTERWNNFDRLALVNGLILSGNSPTLNGQYSVTLYEITHFDKVGPNIPQAGTTTNGGGPGAGIGGPPAGFGGPPNGFGGGAPGGGLPQGGFPQGPGAPGPGEDPNGVR